MVEIGFPNELKAKTRSRREFARSSIARESVEAHRLKQGERIRPTDYKHLKYLEVIRMRNKFKTDLFGFCLELSKIEDPDLIEATKKLIAIIKLEYET